MERLRNCPLAKIIADKIFHIIQLRPQNLSVRLHHGGRKHQQCHHKAITLLLRVKRVPYGSVTFTIIIPIVSVSVTAPAVSVSAIVSAAVTSSVITAANAPGTAVCGTVKRAAQQKAQHSAKRSKRRPAYCSRYPFS